VVLIGAAAVNWRSYSIILLLLSSPEAIFAHHSNASQDRDHQSKLKGTLVEFKWTNPHIQIVFDVKGPSGAIQRWIGEGPSPNQMIENGWTKETLKPGDRISIVGNPSKTGSPVVRLRWVTLPNGRDLFAYNN
jgi:Family of unknown function (DUF6152)